MHGLCLLSPIFLGLLMCRALASLVRLDWGPLCDPNSPPNGNFPQRETTFSFPQTSQALPIKQLTPFSGSCQDSGSLVWKKRESISSGTQCPPLRLSTAQGLWPVIYPLTGLRVVTIHPLPEGTPFPSFSLLVKGRPLGPA